MKKILALLMCLMFTCLVMVGCSSAKTPEKNSTTTSQQSVKQTKQKITAQTLKQNADSKTAANLAANTGKIKIDRNSTYTDKERVAQYIYQYKALPSNYITKNQAKKLGWQTKGTLDKVAPGKSIGGDRYGDYENKLPKANNRRWTECDIDYVKGNRNAKRIVFSNDGLIYYTGDHYKTFTRIDVK